MSAWYDVHLIRDKRLALLQICSMALKNAVSLDSSVELYPVPAVSGDNKV